jgi:xanthine dehydrogenase accessory factor
LISSLIIIRGGGDLGSGVALRFQRVGLQVLIAEQPQPFVVRRFVSFAEAVYQGKFSVEGVTAQRVLDKQEMMDVLSKGMIPVLIDPQLKLCKSHHPLVVVDARMRKIPPELGKETAQLVIGLGPGFVAGDNCHAVVETHRGHTLGRVFWQGSAKEDTGIPDGVLNKEAERVLRAPADGFINAHVEIGDILEKDQLIGEINGIPILSPFHGVLRGLVHPDLYVRRGFKIGDVDPRADPQYCTLVSDKSLAIGGGVLEAVLSNPEIRAHLWDRSLV